MRTALFWLSGASLAFIVTAGAFLLLATFGTAPNASAPIPRGGPSDHKPPGPQLVLRFSERGLEGLERGQNQTLTLYLENAGGEELESANLELTVTSEDTAHPRTRRYWETVSGLAPGEVERIDLRMDLSAPPPAESRTVPGEERAGDREILEARAHAPGAPTAVRTAVVSP